MARASRLSHMPTCSRMSRALARWAGRLRSSSAGKRRRSVSTTMMLSQTLIWSNRRTSWKLRVMPWPGLSWARTTRRPAPSTMTRPPSRGRVPLSRLTSVDFPEPLGPTMLVMPLRGIEMERSSTARTTPKLFNRPRVSRTNGGGSRSGGALIA